jgi:hypothetical protein
VPPESDCGGLRHEREYLIYNISEDIICCAAIWMRIVFPNPGMLPSRSPVASPECSRSTIASFGQNTLRHCLAQGGSPPLRNAKQWGRHKRALRWRDPEHERMRFVSIGAKF